MNKKKGIKRKTSTVNRKVAKEGRKSTIVNRKSTDVEKKASKQPEAVVAGDLRSYELMVVVSPTVKADDRQSVVAGFKKLISSSGGTVSAVDEMGLRDLAYPIAHQLSGWYACLVVSLPAEAANKLESEIKRNDKVLRHLLIRTD